MQGLRWIHAICSGFVACYINLLLDSRSQYGTMPNLGCRRALLSLIALQVGKKPIAPVKL